MFLYGPNEYDRFATDTPALHLRKEGTKVGPGSDHLGSTRIVSDHEKKNIKLNEIDTFTHLKVKSPVKSGPN